MGMEILPPLFVSVVGFSGSGKTSLCERVAPVFIEQGLKVGYLKANAHRIDLDEERKDTGRMRRAGAAAIGIRGRGGAAHFPEHRTTVPEDEAPHARPHEHRSDLLPLAGPAREAADHAARVLLWNLKSLFGHCDLVLVEGLKASSLPKIVVNRLDNPRGALAAHSLSGVILELRWSALPEVWDAPVEAAVQVVRALLDSPARRSVGEVLGCVLAGGASRRMGEDKARLPLRHWAGRTASGSGPGGRKASAGTWCERAFLLLAERFATPWVLGRIAQAGGPDLPGLEWPAASHLDLRAGLGVLGGMETALVLAGGRAALVIPCDLPALAGEALDTLLDHRDSAFAAVAYRQADGRPEPAVALLEPGARVLLEDFLRTGGARAGEFLESVATRWLIMTPELSRGFANLNTPEDRRRYERPRPGSASGEAF